MRSIEVNRISKRNDSVGVELGVTRVIMGLDVLHVDRLGYSGELINVLHVIENIRIPVFNRALVCLEVDYIDFVKSNKRNEGSYVCRGELVATKIAT